MSLTRSHAVLIQQGNEQREQRILEDLLRRVQSLASASGQINAYDVYSLMAQLPDNERSVLVSVLEAMNSNSSLTDEPSFEEPQNVEPTPFEYISFAIACTLLCVCCIGIVLNAISIYIYTRPSMNAPINVLLTALSAVDLLLLLLAIPSFVFPGMNVILHFEMFETSIYYTTLYLYPLTLITQSCSVWLHVLITVERYVAVCHPFRALDKTATRMRHAVLVIVGAAVLYNAIRFWEYTGTGSDDGYHIDYLLRNDPTYYIIYYTALYLITHFAVPFTLFVVLNTCVMKTILEARRDRLKLSNHQKGEHNKSFMMLVVTVIFAVCNSLTLVVNVLEIIDPDISFTHKTLFYILNDTSIILVVLNSSTTCIIYYHFSARYRVLFLYVMCHRCQPSKFSADTFGHATGRIMSTFDGASTTVQARRNTHQTAANSLVMTNPQIGGVRRTTLSSVQLNRVAMKDQLGRGTPSTPEAMKDLLGRGTTPSTPDAVDSAKQTLLGTCEQAPRRHSVNTAIL